MIEMRMRLILHRVCPIARLANFDYVYILEYDTIHSTRKYVFGTYAKGRELDHPLMPYILNKNFPIPHYILHFLMILQADSESPDQTARMRSLIWAFLVRTCCKDTFSHCAAHETYVHHTVKIFN